MEKSPSVKVLYIEDDLSSRLLVQKVLNRPPFEYLDASTGLDGLQLALKNTPDLILMDINLPDISGHELTTKLKNTKGLENVVIVALTGMRDKNVRELILLAGCDGYLTKPIDVENFSAQILQFVGGKREYVDGNIRETLHSQYEISLVEHLTTKVQELERSNRKLEETYQKLQSYNIFLEKKVNILSKLQTCSNPMELKKVLVDEIFEQFGYDRCAFIDVDSSNNLQISYARGIDPEQWTTFYYPFMNAYFENLFQRRRVIWVADTRRIQEPELREQLDKLKTSQFVFAYLGLPMNFSQAGNIRERVQPMLESFLPTLHNQTDADIDIILENLSEYLASEFLYHAGYIFADNYRSGRKITSFEFRFLETVFQMGSYMYQNLLLMEQLRFLFIRAEKEAITDPLTNLFNYRYFIQQLSREVSRDKRHRSHFSLILIDIDFFKKFNDTFGHQAGDTILRRLSKSLIKNTRTSDIVARYGGEEFAIICPELNQQEAYFVAEKLRQIIAKIDFFPGKETPDSKLTISLGVATFPEDGETAYRLIKSADNALYQAKQEGRNKTCVFKQT